MEEKLKKQILRMQDAIEIVQAHNNIRTDFECYLFEICEYGLGRRVDKPKPEDFGL